MDVLLVETPYNFLSRREAPRVFFPLGSLYLSRFLKLHGYRVAIYDPKTSGNIFKVDNNISCLGDGYERIEARIRTDMPAIVGISNLLSKDMNHVFKIARRAKSVSREITTVVGGNHATVAPEEFLASQDIDIVATGEGEHTICDVVRYKKGDTPIESIAGIAFRNQEGRTVVNAVRRPWDDLDDLGFPDFEDIDYRKYWELFRRGMGPRPLRYGRREISIISSRGCPYRCFFCTSHRVMGRRYRAYSAAALLSYIRHMVERLRIDFINFEDDNLTFDKKRFERIVEGLRSYKNLKWATPNGIRADSISDIHVLRAMKKGGCRYLTIGIESGDQNLLTETIKKNLDLDKVKQFAYLCKKAEIPLHAFYIVGFPHETMRQIRSTLDLARMLYNKFDVYPYINYAIPIPGSDLYAECSRLGLLTEPITYRSLVETSSFHGKSKIATGDFTPFILKQQLKEFRRHVFWDSFAKICLRPRHTAQYLRIVLKNLKSFLRQLL